MFSRAVFIVIVSFFSGLAMVLCTSPVQAAGIGVAPHKMEVEVLPSGSVSRSIKVINDTEEDLIYRAYIEKEDLSEWFSISPQEFTLGPGRYQEVKLGISPDGKASGEYKTDVCIVGLVHNSELRIGCGVKVPVIIHVLPAGLQGRIAVSLPGNLSFASLLVIIGFIAAPSVVVLYYKKRRKKIDA